MGDVSTWTANQIALAFVITSGVVIVAAFVGFSILYFGEVIK